LQLSDLASQQPTEAQLMQEQIAVLLDERVSAEGRAAALQVLQQLVEPIDAANGEQARDRGGCCQAHNK
jgi:hypothetical protein